MLKAALRMGADCFPVARLAAPSGISAHPPRFLFKGVKTVQKSAFRPVRAAFLLSSALAACAAAVVLQPGAAARPAGAAALEFFEKEVRPLLARHCYACHSERAATVFGWGGIMAIPVKPGTRGVMRFINVEIDGGESDKMEGMAANAQQKPRRQRPRRKSSPAERWADESKGFVRVKPGTHETVDPAEQPAMDRWLKMMGIERRPK